MVPNPYVYSVSADFPSGAVNPTKLHDEIDDSAIATAMVGVGVVGDAATIEFTGDLSAGDKTILDNDTTGPAGGLIAAHDNTDSPCVQLMAINHDPTSEATDAPKGSILAYNGKLYQKLDDGMTTNVALMAPINQDDGESGGSIWNFVPYSADPTASNNDFYLIEATNVVELMFYDGTTLHVLAASQDADIAHVYASSLGAADEITPSTPENLVKGCTLADAGTLGANWTVENGGTDTAELKYAGARTKKFVVTVVVNFTADESGDVFSLFLNKGATQQAASEVKAECVTNVDGVTMILPFIIELVQNDTLRIMVDSDVGTPIVTPRSVMWTVIPV